mmetsp:Transcript_56377/g.132196  ORF Transcript_56377/g.132196 Transcript_56377/m.132196 type:complete len:933 (-) Transcript_56377:164-2962(-)
MGLPRDTNGQTVVSTVSRAAPTSLTAGLGVSGKVSTAPLLQQAFPTRTADVLTSGATLLQGMPVGEVASSYLEVRSAPPPPPRLIAPAEPLARTAPTVVAAPATVIKAAEPPVVREIGRTQPEVVRFDDRISHAGPMVMPVNFGATGFEVLQPSLVGGHSACSTDQTIALAAEAIASRLYKPLDGGTDRIQADLRAAGDACARAQQVAQHAASRPLTPRIDVVPLQGLAAQTNACEWSSGQMMMPAVDMERSLLQYQSVGAFNGGMVPATCAVPWPPPPLPPVSTELSIRVEALENFSRGSRSSVDVERQLERLQLELREAKAAAARKLKEQMNNSGWQQRLDGLQVSYDQQLEALEELRQSHALLIDERDRIRADIEQMQAARADSDEDVNQLQARLQEIEAEREALKQEVQQLEVGHEELHREWKDKHDTASAERDEMHMSLRVLKEQADGHRSAAEEWRARHQETDEEWRRKHQDLEDIWRKQHQGAEDEWRQRHLTVEEQYRQTHQSIHADKDRLRKDLEQLQAAGDSERKNREEVLQKHKAVENELGKVMSDLSMLEATAQQHVDGKEALARQQREIESEMSRLKTDFIALKGDLAREQAAREEAERRHKVVVQDLEVLRADVMQKEEFRGKLERERYSIEESILKLQTEIKDIRLDKEAQINEMRSICKEEQAKSHSAEVDVNQKSAEIEDLRAQLEQQMSDRERLLNMLDQKKQANNDFRKALENHRAETRVLIEEIEKVKEQRFVTMKRASLRQEVRSSKILTERIVEAVRHSGTLSSSPRDGGVMMHVDLLADRDDVAVQPVATQGSITRSSIAREQLTSGSIGSAAVSSPPSSPPSKGSPLSGKGSPKGKPGKGSPPGGKKGKPPVGPKGKGAAPAPVEEDGPLKRMSSREAANLVTVDVTDSGGEMWDPKLSARERDSYNS